LSMARYSPTRDGFRAMFQRPSVGVAEVLWRWSFGAAFCLLLALCFAEYLRSLPVSKAQLLLIGSGQAVLVVKALQQILAGSSPRLIRAFFLLAVASAVGWVILASIGRAVTLQGLLADRELPTQKVTFRSMLGLSVLRAPGFIGACVFSLAAFALLASSQQGDSSVGAAIFLCVGLVTIIWLAWSAWNWFLSVAAIFVARDGCRTFPAIGRVAGMCADRPGALFVVGFWFGLARLVAVYVASMFCILFVGVAPLMSAAMLAALIASSLAYFLLADFLYIGRLAAYLSVADRPLESLALPDARPFDSGQPCQPASGAEDAAIDQNELILSDRSAEARPLDGLPQPAE
jgi:hypothetical protein